MKQAKFICANSTPRIRSMGVIYFEIGRAMCRNIGCTLLIVAAAASGLAQSPEPPTHFDVVSIKPSAVTNGNFAYRPLPGGGLSGMAVTLKMLIMESYGVKAFQVSGCAT